jgi:hypothetical protein
MIDLAAVTADEPVRPGQYLLVATDAWWMATVHLLGRPDRYRYLEEIIIREWIPPNLADDWFMERENTGGRIWIEGSEEQAARAEVEITGPWPTGRWRAPYGDFFAASAGQPPGPPAEPRWEKPTPEFLAALPRDPAPLLDRLQANGPPDSPGCRRAFRHTADLLRSGLIAAELRVALYEALLTLPGIELVEPGPALAPGAGAGPWPEPGPHAVSLRLDDGPRRDEILIDGDHGYFAGQRGIITQDVAGLRSGTVTESTTVTTTVVDSVGWADS